MVGIGPMRVTINVNNKTSKSTVDRLMWWQTNLVRPEPSWSMDQSRVKIPGPPLNSQR